MVHSEPCSFGTHISNNALYKQCCHAVLKLSCLAEQEKKKKREYFSVISNRLICWNVKALKHHFREVFFSNKRILHEKIKLFSETLPCVLALLCVLAQLAQIIANGSLAGTPYSNCINILVTEFT